ncbi:hypothetical protein GT370_10660 [Acidocella sp. MX-AZ03]|uniref:hypothetical protein n=1 Tax=Acidocella sp. MX-AZ03 TaxID=2697363 RepID=UPI0022DE04FC|nr:hypothetical protein [Acidocella sp. MX-AZ03]WBO57783.1 hypothetical protein GT370_10660 [Acidocella sp. MX-AZ03]
MQDQPQNLRGLKAAVGIMGVLIVIGTTVVIGTIIHRLYARFSAPSTPSVAAASVPAPGAVQGVVQGVVAQGAAVPAGGGPAAGGMVALQPGERVAGIASAGAELAIWVRGPQGERVLLLDPATGQSHAVLAGP